MNKLTNELILKKDIIKMLESRYVNEDNIHLWRDHRNDTLDLLLTDLNNIPTYIPDNCKHCPNHPSNGGSGICHCILGSPIIW